MYRVTNPMTGQVVETFPTAADGDIETAISQAHLTYESWKMRPLAERTDFLRRVAELFLERREELAVAITEEMGKRIDESRGEMDIVADIFTYYADMAPTLLEAEEIPIEGGRAMIEKRPIGVILGIMPWNYPYYQVARFVAPNLALGNTVLLKHAPNCPRSAALIERIVKDAGLPEGVYTNIYATNEQVETIVADPRVQGVSLTGSDRAGEAVGALAGRHLKPVTLELGGSDPMLLLDTDDLDAVVRRTVNTRMSNMGQACSSPKRLIIAEEHYEQFVDGVVASLERFTPGDPMDEGTTLAPVASQAAADRLYELIDDAVTKGATLRHGGHRHDGEGAFVMPTVITDVTPDMDAYYEELFGPVFVIYRAKDEQEAIRIANDSPYGLSGSIFTTDDETYSRVGAALDVGMLTRNRSAGSQADLPFGGVKRSGVGRELGPLGIEAFMNKKIVRL